MRLAKRTVTLGVAIVLAAGAANAATETAITVAPEPDPIRADAPIRVAQFLLGDELACAFDAWADVCMMRELRARLERLGPGLADRYEADYFRWLLQSTEGAMTLVQPEVSMIDVDFIRAVEAMRHAWQGNADTALEVIPTIRNPEARILAWRAISEWWVYSGVTDEAIAALRAAEVELPLLSPGARVHAAEAIAWAQQRLGDVEGVRTTTAIGQAALAAFDGPPVMITFAAMSLAGSLCTVSSKQALNRLSVGTHALAAEPRPPEIDAETWNFATVLAAAWASRSFARCGDSDTANYWAERVIEGLEGLSIREQAHVYAAMVRGLD